VSQNIGNEWLITIHFFTLNNSNMEKEYHNYYRVLLTATELVGQDWYNNNMGQITKQLTAHLAGLDVRIHLDIARWILQYSPAIDQEVMERIKSFKLTPNE
jgi:hypothetical protein